MTWATEHYVENVGMHLPTWGTFLEPDPALRDVDDPHVALGIPIMSGHRANLKSRVQGDPTFRAIAERITGASINCEDQCSAEHYFDLFTRVRRHQGELTHLVDVGVFMGGSGTLLAGCLESTGLELHLVDMYVPYLQFTYERIRRTFPEALPRVRMFQGGLPTYVSKVLSKSDSATVMIHHDGSHRFGDVIRDLSSLYFVKDSVHSLAIQDTHLRGRIQYENFVDAAVFAIFGRDLAYEPIGARHPPESELTAPNRWEGNYFMPNVAEGMFIPFGGVEFRYPHPTMELEEFLPVKAPRPPGSVRERLTSFVGSIRPSG